MIPLALVFLLSPGSVAIAEPDQSNPSLELLEYIGGMEQTEDGQLIDPLEDTISEDTDEKPVVPLSTEQPQKQSPPHETR